MSWLKKAAERAALVIFGLLLALITAEVALRILGISYPTITTFLSQNYYTGWAHQRGIRFPNPVDGRKTMITFNSVGMRNAREFNEKKPADAFRIAFVGDSFTEALQVAEKNDFVSVTERELAGCAALNGKNIQALNFGVFGYGNAQELILLRQSVLRYSPDLVVFQFYTNDLADNNPEAAQGKNARSWTWGPRPYSVIAGGALVEDDSFRETVSIKDNIALAEWHHSRFPKLYGLVLHSRVRQLIYHLRRNVLVRPLFHFERWMERLFLLVPEEQAQQSTPAKDVAATGETNPLFPAFQREAPLLREPEEGSLWARSWEVTERIIAEAAKETKSSRARFLLLIASDPVQVYPDKKLRGEILNDPFYLNRRLEDLANRGGFEVLSLAEPLQQYADSRHAFVHGFADELPRPLNFEHAGWGHYNELGHRLVGDLLSRKICHDQATMLTSGSRRAP